MRPHPPVSLGLEDAAILVEQSQVISQAQVLNILWELVEEKRQVGWRLSRLLLQHLVDEVSHKELAFGGVEEVAASQLTVLVDKPISVVAAAFVPQQFAILLYYCWSPAWPVSSDLGLLIGLYE